MDGRAPTSSACETSLTSTECAASIWQQCTVSSLQDWGALSTVLSATLTAHSVLLDPESGCFAWKNALDLELAYSQGSLTAAHPCLPAPPATTA